MRTPYSNSWEWQHSFTFYSETGKLAVHVRLSGTAFQAAAETTSVAAWSVAVRVEMIEP
jgi:hypothetical protein